MKHYFLTIIFLTVLVLSSFSQTLLTIDGEDISRDEFERIYLKNNKTQQNSSQIDDYMKLFVTFKLKVKEAKVLGYDTVKTFTDEYNDYITQLAEPYFEDKDYEEELLKEAYNRSKKEVRISYIQIRNTSTSDTLEAYNNAMKVYQRLINGEDIEKVGLEVSDPRNLALNPNPQKTDAWYMTVFKMPYILENFVFENPKGKISKPTYIGGAYYILKITDVRPSQGRVKASHIYVRLQQNPSKADSLQAMLLLDTIKAELESGKSFADVAKKYSQDSHSAVNGGDLGWFTTGKMVRNFEKATFNIKKIGEYVGPIRSQVGYHYILLTDKKNIGSYQDERDELLKIMKTNPRYGTIKEHKYVKLKKELNYVQNNSLDVFYDKVDSTIFVGNWKPTAFENDNTILFSFADKKYTNYDFAKYLSNIKTISQIRNKKFFIDNKFKDYVKSELKFYEITRLPDQNDEFKYLAQEYHDGILLFNITQDMVWDKATQDTVGLRNFYIQNRKKFSAPVYLTTYTYTDETALKKLLKLLKKKEKKNLSDSAIFKTMNKKATQIVSMQDSLYKGDSDRIAKKVVQMLENSEKNIYDAVVFKDKKKVVYINENYTFIKGYVINEYQNLLEKMWIAELHKKHIVKINEDVLDEIKKAY